jgi:hypothetical protein
MAKDNVDVVESAWDAFGRGDVETATKIAGAEAEIVIPETVPWGGTYHGPDGFREFLGKLSESFDDFKAVPEKILGADDDHVIVIAQASGTTKSGNQFEGRGAWVYRLQDGKLTEAEFFGDTARALEALG